MATKHLREIPPFFIERQAARNRFSTGCGAFRPRTAARSGLTSPRCSLVGRLARRCAGRWAVACGRFAPHCRVAVSPAWCFSSMTAYRRGAWLYQEDAEDARR